MRHQHFYGCMDVILLPLRRHLRMRPAAKRLHSRSSLETNRLCCATSGESRPVGASEKLDRLTRTFSADQLFCDSLIASEGAESVGELLIYHRFAAAYLPHVQASLLQQVPVHFQPVDRSIAELWTALLIGGILKDISLISYFVIRGLISESGSILRRALEHAGVLTHFWSDPAKARALEDPDSDLFRDTFHRERCRQTAEDLKKRGVLKRFAQFSACAQPASLLYKLASEYDVHGGTPRQLVRTSLIPTRFSCAFHNRTEEDLSSEVALLGGGCQILCFESLNLCTIAGVQSAEVAQGAYLLAGLLSSPNTRSVEFSQQVEALLNELRTDGAHP
jgi:hypothetical protein